jgi:hypothetical protein
VTRGTLQLCPSCGRKWPETASHELRSLAWLGELPRRVSASNPDVLFHDGMHGSDRFLLLEIKRDGEPWQDGQEWFLRAMARVAGFTVRVLRGTLNHLTVERVTPTAVESGRRTNPDEMRSAVIAWVDGNRWQDPEVRPTGAAPRECPSCHLWHPPLTRCAA